MTKRGWNRTVLHCGLALWTDQGHMSAKQGTARYLHCNKSTQFEQTHASQDAPIYRKE